jgi:hypothetical protein
MELALVEALVLEVQMGKRAEYGFKRESFVRMQTAVNLKRNNTSCSSTLVCLVG